MLMRYKKDTLSRAKVKIGVVNNLKNKLMQLYMN